MYEDVFNFQMSDGIIIGYYIGVVYKVDLIKVIIVFQIYCKGVDDIIDIDLWQKIVDVFNCFVSWMSIDKFIDGGKVELFENVLKEIQFDMGLVGIQVISFFYVGCLEYLLIVIESINVKVMVNQKMLQCEQEVK